MQQGYLKISREIERHPAWSRGGNYRGLMFSLALKAAYVERYERGVKILPGQILTSVSSDLSAELKTTPTTLKRMLKNLAGDGFISVQNVANRYSLITVDKSILLLEGGRPTDDQQTTDRLPTDDQRTTDGLPYLYCINKGNKRKKKEESPLPPTGGAGEVEPTPKKQAKPKTGNSLPELRAAIAEYAGDSEPLQTALEDYRLMRERIKKPMTGRALELALQALNKLAADDTALKIAIIEQSVMNSWQGFFALKDSTRAGPSYSANKTTLASQVKPDYSREEAMSADEIVTGYI
jgi:hypothetical protein